jgi:hypothetical protein
MFPSIKSPVVKETRLKNVGSGRYICVTADDQKNHVLSTKTRKLEPISDPDRKYPKLI